jgi:hypothetical protein
VMFLKGSAKCNSSSSTHCFNPLSRTYHVSPKKYRGWVSEMVIGVKLKFLTHMGFDLLEA